jgi:hypothetical protein
MFNQYLSFSNFTYILITMNLYIFPPFVVSLVLKSLSVDRHVDQLVAKSSSDEQAHHGGGTISKVIIASQVGRHEFNSRSRQTLGVHISRDSSFTKRLAVRNENHVGSFGYDLKNEGWCHGSVGAVKNRYC